MNKPGTALSTFPVISLVLVALGTCPVLSKCSLSVPEAGFTAVKMTE